MKFRADTLGEKLCYRNTAPANKHYDRYANSSDATQRDTSLGYEARVWIHRYGFYSSPGSSTPAWTAAERRLCVCVCVLSCDCKASSVERRRGKANKNIFQAIIYYGAPSQPRWSDMTRNLPRPANSSVAAVSIEQVNKDWAENEQN